MNRQNRNRWKNIKVKPYKNHIMLMTKFYRQLYCKELKDAHLSEKSRLLAKYKCYFAI